MMFKTKSIYIRIKRDFIGITDLDTDQTILKQAINPFSDGRNIVSSFSNANETISAVMQELGIKTGFFHPRLKVLIQQGDSPEGGLNDIEKRALRDLAEMTGAVGVVLLEDAQLLSADLARTYLRGNKHLRPWVMF